MSAYDVVGYVPREIKGCEVQEVSYSERWPGNINNDGGEKASPMVFDKMKELMVVYNTEPAKKIESLK